MSPQTSRCSTHKRVRKYGESLAGQRSTSAFPLITLITQVIRRIREQKHRALLMAPLWRNQYWFTELSRLLTAALWPIPLRRDLLSQANGTLRHPQPELWEPSDLPESVLNTISQARAPSTRCLYAFKWSVFSSFMQLIFTKCIVHIQSAMFIY